MEPLKKTEFENLRTQYQELCQDHRAITDFRAKLLTLLPLASGAGIFLLVPKEGSLKDLEADHLAAIGLFGFLITLGLFLHELRGIDHCGELIQQGRSLEEKLGEKNGRFARQDEHYHRKSGYQRLVNTLKGPVGAAWVIYPSVAVAWLYIAALGFKIPVACFATALLVALLVGLPVRALLWLREPERDAGSDTSA